MTSVFDIMATGLFVAAAGLFLYRLQYEDPGLRPYLVTMGTCAVGNWAGNAGATVSGTLLLVAAGFLLMHLASQPFLEDEEDL
jgi:hypothetical protein